MHFPMNASQPLPITPKYIKLTLRNKMVHIERFLPVNFRHRLRRSRVYRRSTAARVSL